MQHRTSTYPLYDPRLRRLPASPIAAHKMPTPKRVMVPVYLPKFLVHCCARSCKYGESPILLISPSVCSFCLHKTARRLTIFKVARSSSRHSLK